MSDLLKVTQQVTEGAGLEPYLLTPAMALHTFTPTMLSLFLMVKLFGSFQSQANLGALQKCSEVTVSFLFWEKPQS